MTIEIETFPAFPVNVHKINLNSYLPLEEYAKELYRIRDEDLDRINQTNAKARSLRSGYRVEPILHANSVFDKYHAILNDILKNGLKQVYEPNEDFMNSYLKFTSWGNISPKYAYNACHLHPGCDWAAILYVKISKSAKTIFHDTRPSNCTYDLWYNNTEYFANEVSFKCNDGEIIIFPSYPTGVSA